MSKGRASVLVRFDDETFETLAKRVEEWALQIMEGLGIDDEELSVLLTDDEEISSLNERYLGRKGPTNVLAFPIKGGPGPQGGPSLLGDVVISVERAQQEAMEAGVSWECRLLVLLIHGVLHLVGFDHERGADDEARMQKEQERLMGIIRSNPCLGT
jgi:probable rRNA maturation factor